MAKSNKTNENNANKVTIKADSIIAAYQLLTAPKTQEREGFVITTLDQEDMYKVLRAVNALKPVSVAFDDFRKDATERLQPEGWQDTVAKFSSMSEEEKGEVNKAHAEYLGKVNECIRTELDKEREIDTYEHLSADAFAKLVKANGHILDVPAILLLQEVIG